MSARRVRMLADLDKEIAETETVLQALKDARRALAGGADGNRRNGANAPAAAAAPNPRNGSKKPEEQVMQAPPAEMSLTDVLIELMSGGDIWPVEVAYEGLGKLGRECSKATVNSALHRGSKPDGPFERVGQGQYRVRNNRGN